MTSPFRLGTEILRKFLFQFVRRTYSLIFFGYFKNLKKPSLFKVLVRDSFLCFFKSVLLLKVI